IFSQNKESRSNSNFLYNNKIRLDISPGSDAATATAEAFLVFAPPEKKAPTTLMMSGNRLKTAFRNSLKTETLDDLLRISVSRPSLSEFDPTAFLQNLLIDTFIKKTLPYAANHILNYTVFESRERVNSQIVGVAVVAVPVEEHYCLFCSMVSRVGVSVAILELNKTLTEGFGVLNSLNLVRLASVVELSKVLLLQLTGLLPTGSLVFKHQSSVLKLVCQTFHINTVTLQPCNTFFDLNQESSSEQDSFRRDASRLLPQQIRGSLGDRQEEHCHNLLEVVLTWIKITSLAYRSLEWSSTGRVETRREAGGGRRAVLSWGAERVRAGLEYALVPVRG
ncbi:unnamed protein product, partial [Timema podura]|nr:unnamed protein product [Timema podura]